MDLGAKMVSLSKLAAKTFLKLTATYQETFQVTIFFILYNLYQYFNQKACLFIRYLDHLVTKSIFCSIGLRRMMG